MRTAIALVAMTLAGVAGATCTNDSSFGCEQDAVCEFSGIMGTCEDTGFCAFPDPGCESGRRYAEIAGNELGGMCVVPTDGSTGPGNTTTTTGVGSTTTTGSPTGDGGSTGIGNCPGWWDCAWSRRRRVSLRNAGRGPLSDFPIVVVLPADDPAYQSAAADASDLRVIDDDGLTELAYEIEVFEPGSVAAIWVRVPMIDGDSDRDFVDLYYGNPAAPAGADPAAVWDDGFAAVWHFGPGLVDSTGRTGSLSGTGLGAAPGVAGDALDANGTNTQALIADPSPLDNTFFGGGTITAWIEPRSYGENGFGRILDKDGSIGSGGALLLISAGNQTVRFEHAFQAGFARWEAAVGAVPLDVALHVGARFEADASPAQPTMFIDGVGTLAVTLTPPSGPPLMDSGVPAAIGNRVANDNRAFDGIIDEVRVSTIARSDDWIAAEHASLTGMLTTIGPEETAPP